MIKLDTIRGTYSFKIIELYKGNYKSSIINGKGSNSNCSFFPFKKDLWIVYANFNQDNTISLDLCLPSQTIKIPPGFLPPIPLFTTSEKATTKLDSLSNEIDNLKIRNETMSNWFYQLEQLRAYKLSQSNSNDENTNDLNNQFLFISLIINGIFFLSLIFILLKNRKYKN